MIPRQKITGLCNDHDLLFYSRVNQDPCISILEDAAELTEKKHGGAVAPLPLYSAARSNQAARKIPKCFDSGHEF